MSLGPMLKRVPQKTQLAQRQDHKAWCIAQQIQLMQSHHAADALEAAIREPPKTYIKAMGIPMDRASTAGKSKRCRRPVFLTPGASDLFNETEKLVKEYINEDLETFREKTKVSGFLERETEEILANKRQGERIWAPENHYHLVDAELNWDEREENRKLNWEIEDHKQQIKWQTRCWIVSRISEKIQDLSAQGQAKVQPVQKEVDRANQRTKEVATDAPRNNVDRTAMPVINDVVEWNEDEVICIPEQSDTASSNTSAFSDVSTNKRKRSETATQASSVDGGIQSPSRPKRQRRNTSKKGKQPLSQVEESHEPPSTADVSPAQPEGDTIRCASVSRNSQEFVGETAPSRDVSDLLSRSEDQEKLAAELRFELQRQSYDQQRMDLVFVLIHTLGETCDLNQRSHELYKDWKKIRGSVKAWCGIIERFREFREETGYEDLSPQGWLHHLGRLSSVERIPHQKKRNELLKWGQRKGISTADFQTGWCQDVAIVLDVLLGDHRPFTFEGLVTHLTLYNRDMLDWFRDRTVIVVKQDLSGTKATSIADRQNAAKKDTRPETILEEQAVDNANDPQSTPRASSLLRRGCATQ